ncbi:aminotransferase class V-fold PLP-dependent enzyme [Marinomonas epiphytica]
MRCESSRTQSTTDRLIDKIRQGIIGKDALIETPFGARQLTYADYTASGRSLEFIEQSILEKVLPWYANTHTEANATGQQTTQYREQARQQIRKAVNAHSDDLVVFCGQGATAAIQVLIRQLGLMNLSDQERQRTCVLIGPYEHHSNELPWRELGVNLIRVKESSSGGICLDDLEQHLQAQQGKRLIGSFSAASNVTGILADQNAITDLLQRYQALACWDFAGAAPYVTLDMNPQGHSAKDAIFFSTHKFIGGPGSPGILVVKKQLIENLKPSIIGGGTVSFVTPNDHQFLPVGERREEGGTPGIVESIRAGMVLALKQAVGCHYIEQREQVLNEKITQRWSEHPQIECLGHTSAPALTITAVRIKTPKGYLHHGFVTALLNDLFGLQVRGGCSCAGPYGHQLLNIDNHKSQRIQEALACQETLLKPGWVRFNLNYFIEDSEANFILQAFEFVAQHGLSLLPYYAYNKAEDLWHFQNKKVARSSFETLCQSWLSPNDNATTKSENSPPKSQYIALAQEVVNACLSGQYEHQEQPFNHQFDNLRDFVLVSDLKRSALT